MTESNIDLFSQDYYTNNLVSYLSIMVITQSCEVLKDTAQPTCF